MSSSRIRAKSFLPPIQNFGGWQKSTPATQRNSSKSPANPTSNAEDLLLESQLKKMKLLRQRPDGAARRLLAPPGAYA